MVHGENVCSISPGRSLSLHCSLKKKEKEIREKKSVKKKKKPIKQLYNVLCPSNWLQPGVGGMYLMCAAFWKTRKSCSSKKFPVATILRNQAALSK